MKPLKFFVRARIDRDDAETARLHAAVFSDIGETVESAKMQLNDPKSAWFVAVAEQNGKETVIGYAACREHSAKVLYWSWFGVLPEWRRHGAGKELLREIMKFAKANQFEQILCDTRNRFKNALVLYLQHGFEIIGTYLGPDGDLMIRLRSTI